MDLAALRAELQALERLCQLVRSPTVFCHNDMLSGNILLVREAGSGEAAGTSSTAAAAAEDDILEVDLALFCVWKCRAAAGWSQAGWCGSLKLVSSRIAGRAPDDAVY